MILTALHKLATQGLNFSPRESAFLGQYEKSLKEHFSKTATIIPFPEENRKQGINQTKALKKARENNDKTTYRTLLKESLTIDLKALHKESNIHKEFKAVFEEESSDFLDIFIELLNEKPNSTDYKKDLLYNNEWISAKKFKIPQSLIMSGNIKGLQRYINLLKKLPNGNEEVRSLLLSEFEYHSVRQNDITYGAFKTAIDANQAEMATFLIKIANENSLEEENIATDMLSYYAEKQTYPGKSTKTFDLMTSLEAPLPYDSRPSTKILSNLKSFATEYAAYAQTDSLIWLKGYVERHAKEPEKTFRKFLDENINFFLENLDGENTRFTEYDGYLDLEGQLQVINTLIILSEDHKDIQDKIVTALPFNFIIDAYFHTPESPLAIALENHPKKDKIWQTKFEDLNSFYNEGLSSLVFDGDAESTKRLFELASHYKKLDELVSFILKQEGQNVPYPLTFALSLFENGYQKEARNLIKRGDFSNFHNDLVYYKKSTSLKETIEPYFMAAHKIGGTALVKELLFSRDANVLRTIKTAVTQLHDWHDISLEAKNKIHERVKESLSYLINKANDLDGFNGVHRLLLSTKRNYVKWHHHNSAQYMAEIREKARGFENDPGLMEPDYQFLVELQKWHSSSAMEVLAPYISSLTDEDFRSIFCSTKGSDESAFLLLIQRGELKKLIDILSQLSKNKRKILHEELVENGWNFSTNKTFETVLNAVDTKFETEKEERLFYKKLYLEHGRGNERWLFITGNAAPHKDLEDASPFGFYGPKIKLYQHLLPMMKTATQLEGNTGAETNAFKFSVLFRNKQQVEQYLDQYEKRWNHSNSKQIVHDAALFNLPRSGKWSPHKWGDLIAQFGPQISKHLSNAVSIEEQIKKEGVPFPTTAEEVLNINARLFYTNAKENIEFAKMAKEHEISEWAFDEGVQILKRAKTSDHLPDIFIDGADIGFPKYYMRKLKAGDPRGLILGAETKCCQHIDGDGKDCAIHGTTSEFGGFYVWQKKTKIRTSDNKNTKMKITDKDPVIAQSWAWIGKDQKIILDSFERLSNEYNELSVPFMEQMAFEVSGKHTYTHQVKAENDDTSVSLSHCIKGIRLGGGGNTPSNLFQKSVKKSELSEPFDTEAYDATGTQYEIDPVDHKTEYENNMDIAHQPTEQKQVMGMTPRV